MMWSADDVWITDKTPIICKIRQIMNMEQMVTVKSHGNGV